MQVYFEPEQDLSISIPQPVFEISKPDTLPLTPLWSLSLKMLPFLICQLLPRLLPQTMCFLEVCKETK